MDAASRHREVKELFARAVELDPRAREAFLDGACGGDAGLRVEVRALLEADAVAGSFLHEASPEPAAAPAVGRRFGPYRLVDKVDEGGLSVVYLAVRDDEEYVRRVAIKFLQLGAASEESLRRLRAERQILAALDHPGIARLLDGGTTGEGVPYLVMEYIEGEPIDAYCGRRGLGLRERIELFRHVCGAVQYAHRNLVVHRDIKPSNILVRADGVPKLLDFGIAKLLNPELSAQPTDPTGFDSRLMTPQYASPEQVRGRTITTSTDVYSLGVLLYRLLSGRAPYEAAGASLAELSRTICEAEPPPPSRVGGAAARELRGDLDTIVLKALRKEPEARYGSVEQLSEDLERFLTGRPIRARQPATAYRLGKFVRRNRAAVTAAGLVLAVVVGFSVTALRQAARVRAALAVAERESARSTAVKQFLRETLRFANPLQMGAREITISEALERAEGRIGAGIESEPGLEATLRHNIGAILSDLGHLERAEGLLRAALGQRRRLLGEEHLDVAESELELGDLLRERGRLDEAVTLLERSLETRRRALGEEHALVAQSLNDLGLALRARDDLARAERACRRALAIREGRLGERHPDVAETLSCLGGLRYAQGDLAGAAKLFRRSLGILRAARGPRHSQAIDLQNLAVTLGESGEYAEAAAVDAEALAMAREAFGDDHNPLKVHMLSNQAIHKALSAEAEEGERLARQALALAGKVYGEEHPQVAHAWYTLGLALIETGNFAEAEAALRRSRNRRNHGEATMLWKLGVLRSRQGRGADAELLLGKALAMLESRTPGHYLAARMRSDLGLCLMQQGRLDEAEQVLLAAHAGLVAAFGPQSPHARTAAARLREVREAAQAAAGS